MNMKGLTAAIFLTLSPAAWSVDKGSAAEEANAYEVTFMDSHGEPAVKALIFTPEVQLKPGKTEADCVVEFLKSDDDSKELKNLRGFLSEGKSTIILTVDREPPQEGRAHEVSLDFTPGVSDANIAVDFDLGASPDGPPTLVNGMWWYGTISGGHFAFDALAKRVHAEAPAMVIEAGSTALVSIKEVKSAEDIAIESQGRIYHLRLSGVKPATTTEKLKESLAKMLEGMGRQLAMRVDAIEGDKVQGQLYSYAQYETNPDLRKKVMDAVDRQDKSVMRWFAVNLNLALIESGEAKYDEASAEDSEELFRKLAEEMKEE